jgi:hypothetical protein
LVDHVTEVTPTLSLAVPLKTIDAAEVETDVEDGDTMVSEGGVVFDVEVGDVGVGAGVGEVVDVVPACVRVTTADCETTVTPSVAVTAMVFDPTANGTPEILQPAPAICPVPEVPCAPSQVTAMVPLPPETVPPRFTLAAVVLPAGALIVIVNGTDGTGTGGAGVGADVGVVPELDGDGVPLCTAYNVCTVLTSSGDNPVTI